MNNSKDPDAVLDYVWYWTAWLAAAETIATAVVTVPVGLTLNPSGHTTTILLGKVTAWLSGGVVGARYDVTCRISTNQGRTDDRTRRVRVAQR